MKILRPRSVITAEFLERLARHGYSETNSALRRVYSGELTAFTKRTNYVSEGTADLHVYNPATDEFEGAIQDIEWFDTRRRGATEITEGGEIGYFIYRPSVGKWELLKNEEASVTNTECADCECDQFGRDVATPISLLGFNLPNRFRLVFDSYDHELLRRFDEPRTATNSSVILTYAGGATWSGTFEYDTNDYNLLYGFYPYMCAIYNVELFLWSHEYVSGQVELRGQVTFTPASDYCSLPDDVEVKFNSLRPIVPYTGAKNQFDKLGSQDYYFGEKLCLAPHPSFTSKVFNASYAACLYNVELTFEFPSLLTGVFSGSMQSLAYFADNVNTSAYPTTSSDAEAACNNFHATWLGPGGHANQALAISNDCAVDITSAMNAALANLTLVCDAPQSTFDLGAFWAIKYEKAVTVYVNAGSVLAFTSQPFGAPALSEVKDAIIPITYSILGIVSLGCTEIAEGEFRLTAKCRWSAGISCLFGYSNHYLSTTSTLDYTQPASLESKSLSIAFPSGNATNVVSRAPISDVLLGTSYNNSGDGVEYTPSPVYGFQRSSDWRNPKGDLASSSYTRRRFSTSALLPCSKSEVTVSYQMRSNADLFKGQDAVISLTAGAF